MKGRKASWIVLAVLATLLAWGISAQTPAERSAGDDPGVPRVPALQLTGDQVRTGPIGTLNFDNNTPFRRDGTDGGTVGNRFNPTQVHSVATVSFALAGNFGDSVGMTVWDINAGTAMVLARQLVGSSLSPIGSNPATTLRLMAPVATAISNHSGSFVAGIRNSDYAACSGDTGLATTCDGVALTQGMSPAPGAASNAVRIPFTSTMFVPLIQTVASTGDDIAGVNAIFRATGKNLPVELMQFTVD